MDINKIKVKGYKMKFQKRTYEEAKALALELKAKKMKTLIYEIYFDGGWGYEIEGYYPCTEKQINGKLNENILRKF